MNWTGVRAEINVKVVSIGNGRYKCTYIPVVPGAYLLHITWNGRQLRGSPYKVSVIGAFYPTKYKCRVRAAWGNSGKEHGGPHRHCKAGPGN